MFTMALSLETKCNVSPVILNTFALTGLGLENAGDEVLRAFSELNYALQALFSWMHQSDL